MNRLLVFTIFLLLSSQMAWGQITGTIYDENHIPLPGASVLLLPDSVFQVTDEEGVFTFSELSEFPRQTLEVRFLAYETKVVRWTPAQNYVKIYLQPQETLLETVVVTDEHAKQEASLANTHFGEELLTENLQGTFAKSIERLPGINAINVGVGVAKPVIRGLSSNRIIVNQQGIKQESHQWGSDHGLEVDQFDVERVEIVKGPASLQYGSDGLGGVINILPGRVPARDTYLASVQGVHKTNNQHWGGSALLSANIKDVFVAARYSQQEFGDYRVPATQFTYNGYALPIFNNTLKNTAGQEQNLRLTAGWKGKNSITRVLYGHYALRTGIFSGAVGIPRSYSLADDGNTRDLDVPRQEVDHYRLSVHHSAYWGEDHLDINLGYQKNDRREFSFPEFHNIPSSQILSNDVLGLGLALQTLSGDVHYSRHHGEEHHTVYGLNIQHQQNQRRGFEFLLPDFQTWRSGAYIITEWQPRAGWTWNAGLRADFASNATAYYRQWIWDSNENIVDSLVAPLTEETYLNWSASVGGSWQADEHWNFKLNLGKSFRVPYPAELVSNGIHHGTFRHEVGTPDLRSEHGYQLDGNVIGEWERFQFEFAAYFNYFDNYIYLGPTFPAQFSPLPEAGQIFQYRQDDAIYTGFEGSWQWQAYPRLLLAQSMDFVQSYNITTGLALPFTPQPRLQQRIRYEVERMSGLREWFVELSHQYNFAAEGVYRIDRSERATPAYQLWQVGAGAKVVFAGQELQLNVQVQNLFDTAYFNHLSRYRLINVPEQGRNVVVSVKVPVKGSFR